MTPFEIIMSPFEVYLAPVGTAFPDVDDAPTGSWALLGTNGKTNYSEDGVVVAHEQTLSPHRTAGSTGPVKVTRTEESLLIRLTLEDLTMEQYSKVFNSASISTVVAASGVPGTKTIELRQGHDVNAVALLVRGVSPYGDTLAMQYQVRKAVQNANPAPTFNKGDAAGLEVEFMALEDLTAATPAQRFGRLVAQTAAALP